MSGFMVSYEAILSGNFSCNFTLTDNSVSFGVGVGTAIPYSADMNCWWTLPAVPNLFILITFTSFDTEEDGGSISRFRSDLICQILSMFSM
jgi:hypothetical protein